MISDGSSPVVPPGTAPAGTPHTQSMQPETRSVSAVTVAGSEVKPPKTPPLDNIVQVPQSGIGGFGQNGILGWTVEGVKAALGAHLAGTFGGTGMLSDAMWSHPVIKKCREERNDFLSKIPRQVTPRRKRDKAARYAADWFKEFRDVIFPDNVLRQWHDDDMQMGQFVSGMDWEERRDGRHRWWLPVHKPWHPSQLQYFYRGIGRSIDGGAFHATTLNKGLLIVEPGLGRWVLGQRAARQPWLHGAVFALGNDFVGDGYNFFDNLAFQERFGIGFMQYFHNVDYQRGQVDRSAVNIQTAGAGAVIPMRVDAKGEKLEWLELLGTTAGGGSQAFDQTENRIKKRICYVYLGQDMTTAGQPGGYKLGVVHQGIEWNKFEESASWFFDARKAITRDPKTRRDIVTWEPCDGVLYEQVSRWVGWYNFGDWDCMPHYWLDATPPEDLAAREEQQSKYASETGTGIARIATALPNLRAAMPEVAPRAWFALANLLPEVSDTPQSTAPAMPTPDAEGVEGVDDSDDASDIDGKAEADAAAVGDVQAEEAVGDKAK